MTLLEVVVKVLPLSVFANPVAFAWTLITAGLRGAITVSEIV